MSQMNRVLAAAASQIGYYEQPGGRRSRFEDWYGMTGAWCAMFVSWAASQGTATTVIPRHAYTPSGVNWFKAHGQWHGGLLGVRRGDLVYFDFPGVPDRVSHVGLVESVNTDGSVTTIEGNTAMLVGGDQRNGGCVGRKRRSRYAVGYGRPAWVADAVPVSHVVTPVKKPVKVTPPKQVKPPARQNSYQVGERGLEVALLQKALNRWYPGLRDLAADGVYGPKTAERVRYFQRKAHLVVDGIAGPVTLARLGVR